MTRAAHRTRAGAYYVGKAEDLLRGDIAAMLHGKVQLILTSPPFPLNNKKSYGNLTGEKYLKWFVELAKLFSGLLSPDGSIVIELGNAWTPGRPVQSLLPLECLMGFVNSPGARLRLCQQFICYNPARLPTPAQWVTIKRTRLTDSYTNVWWMANSDNPKADNRRVLRPYSESMKSLLRRQSYNDGRRPSEHEISKRGFLKRHRGSIQPNLFELEPLAGNTAIRLPNAMRVANTGSNGFFLRTCREREILPHPARMPPELAAFFVEFLTDPGDLVLDPFAGSNTTGFVAELLGRRWVSIDVSGDYVEQSRLRFQDPILKGARKSKE
jgi:site-specific DNA-methyltransferase (cytosine-N4-specific)